MIREIFTYLIVVFTVSFILLTLYSFLALPLYIVWNLILAPLFICLTKITFIKALIVTIIFSVLMSVFGR